MSQELDTKIQELTNTSRLVGNTIAILHDVEIKGSYAQAVAECLMFLNNFKQSIQTQCEILQGLNKAKDVELVDARTTVPTGMGDTSVSV